MPCIHAPTGPASLCAPVPDRSTYKLDKSSNQPPGCGKACSPKNLERIVYVRPDFWASLNHYERVAVIGHELGHLEGTTCEACADRRAGAIMRARGYSRDLAQRAFARIVKSRPNASHDAAEGWDAMDRAMKGSK